MVANTMQGQQFWRRAVRERCHSQSKRKRGEIEKNGPPCTHYVMVMGKAAVVHLVTILSIIIIAIDCHSPGTVQFEALSRCLSHRSEAIFGAPPLPHFSTKTLLARAGRGISGQCAAMDTEERREGATHGLLISFDSMLSVGRTSGFLIISVA